MVETATTIVASDFLGKTITLTNNKYDTTQSIGKCENITLSPSENGEKITSIKLEGYSLAFDIAESATSWNWTITQVA